MNTYRQYESNRFFKFKKEVFSRVRLYVDIMACSFGLAPFYVGVSLCGGFCRFFHLSDTFL